MAGQREALGEVQRRAWFEERIPSQAGPQMVFGRLYQWLHLSKNQKEVGPIRDIARQHILDTMYVAPGTMLMGAEVSVARKHTVASLSKLSGIHPKTLRNALALAGLIPDRSVTGGEALFDADEGLRVVDELADSVTQLHLPAYMNATRSQVIILVEGGFLKRMMDVGSSAKASSSISKREVHAFLDSISRDVQVVDVLPAGVWPINKATQKAKVSTDEVIRLLQNGALKHVYRVRGEEGYLSIRVDPEEIKGHFVPDPETTPLGVHLTAKALGMSGAAVKAFVLEGLIDTATPNNGTSETKQIAIMPEAVRRFKETYVGLMQLGQELGMHHMTLKNALRNLGIKPVAVPAVLTVTLFRRTDIPPEFYKNVF